MLRINLNFRDRLAIFLSVNLLFALGGCAVRLNATQVSSNATSTSASTTTVAKPISLSNVPSRISGVAPLYVFFDATGTTALSTTQPYHDLQYSWNFGESSAALAALPGGLYWNAGSSTSNSRNLATGPVASHVFETPGTYTVTLSATDGTNTATDSTVQIQVLDPNVVFAGANTVCFSTSGTFTGCPAGAVQVTTSDFQNAVATYQATGMRLLFRRTETFTAAGSASITTTGPGIIGAYGSGAAPIVQMTGNSTTLMMSMFWTPGIGDWRVMDLEINGMAGGSSAGIGSDGTFNQFLALRLNIHNYGNWGAAIGPSILDYDNNNGHPGQTLYQEWAVVDSTFTSAGGGVGLAGSKMTVQGNTINAPASGYCLSKSVINNNTFSGGSGGTLSIVAQDWTTAGVCNPGGVGTYVEQIEMADNSLTGNSTGPWILTLGSTGGSGLDGRTRNVILERNLVTAGSATQVAFEIWATDTTVRNNIVNMTAGTYHTGMGIGQRENEPPPNNVYVFNNTFYTGSSAALTGIGIDTLSTNVSVVNNLVSSASTAPTPAVVSGTGASGLVDLNNFANTDPSALFVNATPAVPADFNLIPLPNPARDTGLSVPVFSDFFLTSRPQHGVIDIGAVEGL